MADTATATNARTAPRAAARARDEGRARPGFVREVRASMPAWREKYPGVEGLNLAVMGCIVNGPGESKHADIGISLPGTGEQRGGAAATERLDRRAHRGALHGTMRSGSGSAAGGSNTAR